MCESYVNVQIPLSWKSLMRQDIRGNVQCNAVLKKIECGEEIVLRPETSTTSKNEAMDLTSTTPSAGTSLVLSGFRVTDIL